LKHKSHIAPVVELGQIHTLTTIIDKLNENMIHNKQENDFMKKLKEEGNEDEIKEIYEAFFIFAGMWAFGASLDEDKLSFSNTLKRMSKIKFPE
jgi:hypothetical protein